MEERRLLSEMVEGSDPDDYEENLEKIDPVRLVLLAVLTVQETELARVPAEVGEDAKLEVLGEVYALMSPFVVVSPRASLPVLDVGSLVLCLESRRVLGVVGFGWRHWVMAKVWDVFGPVASPMYSVLVRPALFEGLERGRRLGFSPDFVSLVSKEALVVEKGIDADAGAAPEFSDDEDERMHKKGLETGEILQ